MTTLHFGGSAQKDAGETVMNEADNVAEILVASTGVRRQRAARSGGGAEMHLR
jgi:hypothetical protein